MIYHTLLKSRVFQIRRSPRLEGVVVLLRAVHLNPMCGRVASKRSPGALQRVLGAAIVANAGSYRPGYNVGPGRYLPVLRKGCQGGQGPTDAEDTQDTKEDGVVLHMMKWGLIPSYTKMIDGKLKTQCDFNPITFDEIFDRHNLINARSEGLKQSGAFRRLLKRRYGMCGILFNMQWRLSRWNPQSHLLGAVLSSSTVSTNGRNSRDSVRRRSSHTSSTQ
eukprot:1368915-Amorphochlora_amoeboformis.AAC.1